MMPINFTGKGSACAVACVLAAMIAAAPAGAAGDADTYLDPLAYTRVDGKAVPLSLSVEYRDTGGTAVVTGRRLLADSKEVYLSSATLATMFKAGRYWQESLRKLDLEIGGETFTVLGGSRVVTNGRGQALLPVPVLDHEGDLWLPVVLLTQVIGPQAQINVEWDAGLGRFALGAAAFNVSGISVEILGRSTVVHVRCSQPLAYKATNPRAGLIEIVLTGGAVDAAAIARVQPRGLLRSAASAQQAGQATVTLNVDQLVGDFRTYVADAGREIVVVLEEEQVAAMPEPVPAGQANVDIVHAPVDAADVGSIRRIVIDAGHGGSDTGAVGRQGIVEKDVNLAVARELKRYLERESDMKVFLTRDRDEVMDLASRAEAANTAGGDLFISLHCNGWFDSQAHGVEVYFLSPARSDWARSVEATENENAGSGPREPGDVEFIVWELVQNRFISSSSQLAEKIQSRVSAELGLPDRGVKQAGFRVLVGAYMPAVLMEMGFLSHAQEELRLGDSSYQRELARAIGRALLEFASQGTASNAGAGGYRE